MPSLKKQKKAPAALKRQKTLKRADPLDKFGMGTEGLLAKQFKEITQKAKIEARLNDINNADRRMSLRDLK